MDEAPGFSVFQKDPDGSVFHTYSTYSRGLDMFNGAYYIMDMMPKGRDEDALPFTMSWLKRYDHYQSSIDSLTVSIFLFWNILFWLRGLSDPSRRATRGHI